VSEGPRRQMSADEPPDPLARLGEKLDRARREQLGAERNGGGSPPPGTMGLGFRIAVELVAALCVGLALGWVFDHFLGTRPWGLIVFFLLGIAAGMVNVFRAAAQLGAGTTRTASRRHERD
jgi:ATP synthase protein I